MQSVGAFLREHGTAQIDDLDPAVGHHHDVLRVDVAVHPSGGVGDGERVEQLREQADGVRGVNAAAASLNAREVVGQVLALYELFGKAEGLAARGLLVLDAGQPEDLGVELAALEAAQRTELREQALLGRRREGLLAHAAAHAHEARLGAGPGCRVNLLEVGVVGRHLRADRVGHEALRRLLGRVAQGQGDVAAVKP